MASQGNGPLHVETRWFPLRRVVHQHLGLLLLADAVVPFTFQLLVPDWNVVVYTSRCDPGRKKGCCHSGVSAARLAWPDCSSAVRTTDTS